MRLLECFSRRGLSCLLIAGAFGIAPPVIAQPILVGDVARADLQKPPFTEWFDPQYSGYQPVAETVEKLRAPLKGLSVIAGAVLMTKTLRLLRRAPLASR